MENRKRNLFIVIGITVILFIAFFCVMLKMIKESGECIDDPFSYSARRLKESGGIYSCHCDSLTQELLDFSFNEDGIKIIKQTDIKDLNISDIKIKK